MQVPCGRCIGCRIDKTREWSTRIAHEASLHDENSFITLTYRDEDLPDDYSVRVRHLQLFMKRLRKIIAPVKVRFFACGEYGEQNGRPHYHVILFGYGFPDKVVWRQTKSGHLQYRSEILEKAWTQGHCEIGTVTKQSGGYVARYVIKKVGGAMAPDHYQRIHPITGELCWVVPEFMCCSTNPGIGGNFIDKFASDAFPSGFLVQDGQKVALPKYYKRRIAAAVESGSASVQESDMEKARRKTMKIRLTDEFQTNSRPDRLAVRETCLELKVERLKRDLDAGN
jgi:hypothetical protein